MKNSPILDCTDDYFKQIILSSKNYSDALRNLGYSRAHGGSYATIKKRIKKLNINTSHFNTHNKETKIYSNDEIFIKNSPFKGQIRRRVLRDNLVPYKCAKCGNTGEWLGNKLTLTLDHINGDHNDNRIENLQFICPNCDSQQDTYCFKNKHKYTKKVRPTKEKLIQDILVLSLVKIGEKYGVSDNAVRKWCKKYDLPFRYHDIKEFRKKYFC